jgi:hypothetical protein
MKVRFIGIIGGRPRFDFGDGVPPKWLRELVGRAKVVGNELRVDGKTYAAGTYISEP